MGSVLAGLRRQPVLFLIAFLIMGAKGGGKNCCCIGCASPPLSGASSGVDTLEADPAKAIVAKYCLACAPLQLCANVDCGDGFPSNALLGRQDAGCSAEPYALGAGTWYSGNAFDNTTVFAVHVFFDVVGHDCYLCLSSDYLGVAGTESFARILITEGVRGTLSPTCQHCQDPKYPPTVVQWSIPKAHGGYCVVTVWSADTTSLIPTTPCPGCPDPCADAYSTAGPSSTIASCAGICAGCDCIATTACVIVEVNSQVIASGGILLCNAHWANSTVDIGINADPYTGQCQLWLNGVTGSPAAAGVLPIKQTIGLASNPCPDPVVQFAYTDLNGKAVQVTFTPSECGECDNLKSTSCCGRPLSRVTTLTIKPSAVCACGGSLTLVDTSIGGNTAWQGKGKVCNTDHTATVTCSGGGQFQLQISGPCLQATVLGYGSCDPLQMTFHVQGSESACCGITPYPITEDYEIVWTE